MRRFGLDGPMKDCPYCSRPIQDEAQRCKHCKRDIERPCPFCAEAMPAAAEECPHCQSRVELPRIERWRKWRKMGYRICGVILILIIAGGFVALVEYGNKRQRRAEGRERDRQDQLRKEREREERRANAVIDPKWITHEASLTLPTPYYNSYVGGCPFAASVSNSSAKTLGFFQIELTIYSQGKTVLDRRVLGFTVRIPPGEIHRVQHYVDAALVNRALEQGEEVTFATRVTEAYTQDPSTIR